MVKPLSFKGDPKSKKRKHRPASPPPSALSKTTPTDSNNNEGDVDLEGDQTWAPPSTASELTGPTTLILSKSFLSADPSGKIFLTPLDPADEDDPSIQLDESPFDVRQVWIATRPKDSDLFALKSSSGGYLSCSSDGQLNATATARGEREGWQILPHPISPSAFILKSGTAGAYISLLSHNAKPTLRVVDDEKEAVKVKIQMQSRFKPTIQAAKRERAYEKISRSQMEKDAGRRLDDDEARKLKRARKEGDYHEAILDVRAKGRSDKFA